MLGRFFHDRRSLGMIQVAITIVVAVGVVLLARRWSIHFEWGTTVALNSGPSSLLHSYQSHTLPMNLTEIGCLANGSQHGLDVFHQCSGQQVNAVIEQNRREGCAGA